MIARKKVRNTVFLFFALLFFLSPFSVLAQVPGGEEIPPPSGNVWEIYCYGNGDTMAAVFEGLALLLQGGTIGALVKLAIVAAMVVLFGYMAFGLFSAGPYRIMLTPFQGLFIAAVTFFMFTAKADVAIYDRYNPFGGTTVIQNVPFFAAFPASVFSRIGDKMVEKFEEVFMPILGTSDELAVQSHGFGFSPSLLNTVSQSVPPDANFLRNLAFYIDRCVGFEMESLYGQKRDWNVVLKGQSLDDILESYNRAVEITITEPACPDISDVTVPCPDLYTQCIKPVLLGQQSDIMEKLKNSTAEAKGIDRATLDSIMNELVTTVLGYSSISTNEFWAAVVANNVLDETLFENPAGSLGYAQAVYSANTTWESAGRFLRELLPEIRSIFEILLYSFSVFLPLVFFTFRLKALMTYLATALWLQLWGVAYAVGNFIAIDKLMKLQSTIADCGVGIYCLDAIKMQTAYSLAASHLPVTLGIILLGGLIYGGEYAFIKGTTLVTGDVTAKGLEGAGQASDFQKTGSMAGTHHRAVYEGMSGIAEYSSRQAFMKPVYFMGGAGGESGMVASYPGYKRLETSAFSAWWDDKGHGIINMRGTGGKYEVQFDPGSGMPSKVIAASSPMFSAMMTGSISESLAKEAAMESTETVQARKKWEKEVREAEAAVAKSLYEMHEASRTESGHVDTGAYARRIEHAFGLEEKKARELAERAEKVFEKKHASRGDKYVGMGGGVDVSFGPKALTKLIGIEGKFGGQAGYRHHWVDETGKTSATSTSTGTTSSTGVSDRHGSLEFSFAQAEDTEKRLKESGVSEKTAQETAREIREAWEAERELEETYSEQLSEAKRYLKDLKASDEYKANITREMVGDTLDYSVPWVAGIRKADMELSSGGAKEKIQEIRKRIKEEIKNRLDHPVSDRVEKEIREAEKLKAEAPKTETTPAFPEKEYRERKAGIEKDLEERKRKTEAGREKMDLHFRERKAEMEKQKSPKSPKPPSEPEEFEEGKEKKRRKFKGGEFGAI